MSSLSNSGRKRSRSSIIIVDELEGDCMVDDGRCKRKNGNDATTSSSSSLLHQEGTDDRSRRRIMDGDTDNVLFLDNGAYSIKSALYRCQPMAAMKVGQPNKSDDIIGGCDQGNGRQRHLSASNNNETTTRNKYEIVQEPFIIPNCIGASSSPAIGKGLIGHVLSALPHYHGLMVRRPMDRGLLVDARLQKLIWENILVHYGITDESRVHLIVTVAFGTPLEIAAQWHLLCFQYFRFKSVTFVSASFLSLLYSDHCRYGSILSSSCDNGTNTEEIHESSPRGTGVVVDCGFSSSTVIPYVHYTPVYDSIQRVEVGGKLLTNRLKELISFSQLNVLEDTWLVNIIKEAMCYVSLDFSRELIDSTPASKGGPLKKRSGAPVTNERGWRRESQYVLPTTPATSPIGGPLEKLRKTNPNALTRKGGGTESIQMVKLKHECFCIPEILFSPMDIGISQLGIAEAVVSSVTGGLGECCDDDDDDVHRLIPSSPSKRDVAAGKHITKGTHFSGGVKKREEERGGSDDGGEHMNREATIGATDPSVVPVAVTAVEPKCKFLPTVPFLHPVLFSNVVLYGGTTNLDGFDQRLVSDVQKWLGNDDYVDLDKEDKDDDLGSRSRCRLAVAPSGATSVFTTTASTLGGEEKPPCTRNSSSYLSSDELTADDDDIVSHCSNVLYGTEFGGRRAVTPLLGVKCFLDWEQSRRSVQDNVNPPSSSSLVRAPRILFHSQRGGVTVKDVAGVLSVLQ